MKTLLLASLLTQLASAAVLLGRRSLALRYPWFVAANRTAADPSSCHPKCAWDCAEPSCMKSCKAVCQPPVCRTTCKSPKPEACRNVCKDPNCAVVCPAQKCHAENCPDPLCDTVCGTPECSLDCSDEVQGCETTCDDPVCNFDCEVKECEKADCKVNCPATPEWCRTARASPGSWKIYKPEDVDNSPRLTAWKGIANVPKEHDAARLREKMARVKAKAEAAKYQQVAKPVKNAVTQDVPRGRLGPPDLTSIQ